jgi:hypothetical protein
MNMVGYTDADLEALCAEIHEAFDGVSREGGTTLHEGEEIDCHGSPEELALARQRDNESRWQEVPFRLIEEMPDAVGFLNVIGFRYYLPVVMLWSMATDRSTDGAADDNVESRLRDPQFQELLIPLLTSQQCRAIGKWLKLRAITQGHPPEKASAEFTNAPWAAYLKDKSSN